MSPVEIDSNSIGGIFIDDIFRVLPYIVDMDRHVVISHKEGNVICEVWGTGAGGYCIVSGDKRNKTIMITPANQEKISHLFLTGIRTPST